MNVSLRNIVLIGSAWTWSVHASVLWFGSPLSNSPSKCSRLSDHRIIGHRRPHSHWLMRVTDLSPLYCSNRRLLAHNKHNTRHAMSAAEQARVGGGQSVTESLPLVAFTPTLDSPHRFLTPDVVTEKGL